MKSEIRLSIETRYGDMRASEQKVANYVLDHFEEIPNMSLKELSDQCGVSQPTALRMVRAIGFWGFKDFRHALIMELAKNQEIRGIQQPMYGFSLEKEDRLEDVPRKIVTTTSRVLEENLKNISMKTYKKVIDVLNHARMIDIYSVENSNVAARDLLTKLLYLGLNCRYMDDSYHQRICAGNLTKDDAAIGISYSGCSEDTVEAVKAAKRSKATTIVITNFRDSVISKYADLLICTSQEQLFYGDAIFSRTSQLALVDMIYMGLIISDYDKYAQKLDASSRLIQDKTYAERNL